MESSQQSQVVRRSSRRRRRTGHGSIIDDEDIDSQNDDEEMGESRESPPPTHVFVNVTVPLTVTRAQMYDLECRAILLQLKKMSQEISIDDLNPESRALVERLFCSDSAAVVTAHEIFLMLVFRCNQIDSFRHHENLIEEFKLGPLLDKISNMKVSQTTLSKSLLKPSFIKKIM
jgi:hypothetical protein